MPMSEATRKAREERALADIDAAVKRNLAKASPLTDEQKRTISRLLRTGMGLPPLPVPRPEPRLETDEEYESRLSALLSKELSQCRSCGIPKERHGYPEHFGYISHTHEALTVSQVREVVEAFSRQDHPRLTILG